MQLAILTDTPFPGEIHTTPYGDSAPIARLTIEETEVLVTAQGYADPRATIRAIKEAGATHLWLCESVGALSPLLEPGDWIVPDDFIDGTRGQHYTYFSEKAGGYVQQVPPFDPASREALLDGLHESIARPFRRGVYVCVSNTRLETPAEAAFWTRAGGHVVGRFLSPCLPLARELEMKVALLAHVTRGGGEVGATEPFQRYLSVLAAALHYVEAEDTSP
jgi:5'-methylthioadenosine phosphorylase